MPKTMPKLGAQKGSQKGTKGMEMKRRAGKVGTGEGCEDGGELGKGSLGCRGLKPDPPILG